MYYKQMAVVRVEGTETYEIEIQRVVSQGYVMSPQLFILYSQFVFQKALEQSRDEVIIGRTLINNVRFLDDTAIISETVQELQIPFEREKEREGESKK